MLGITAQVVEEIIRPDQGQIIVEQMFAHTTWNGVCENLEICLRTDGLARCILQICDIREDTLQNIPAVI